MCMIALRPGDTPGAHMPNRVIDTAMDRHPDGFGVAWREDGTLKVAKFAPKERKAFRKALKAVDRSGVEYVAHFRWATHGPKAASHSHPYEYEDPDPKVGKVLVFHNGVIDIRTTPAQSDTEVFVKAVLAELPSRWWASGALAYLVSEAIGYSKLVIMTKDETVNLNADRGDWDGGLWYSSNHRPTIKATTYTPGRTTGGSWRGDSAKNPSRYTKSDGSLVDGWWDEAGKRWVEVIVTEAPKVTADNSILAQQQRESAAKFAAIEAEANRNAANAAAGRSLVPYAGNTDTGAVVRVVDRVRTFKSGGHNLTAIKDIDMLRDGDYEDAVICDTCRTIGTVYIIEGEPYIEVGHRAPGATADDEDGDEDLLPDESEDLLRYEAYVTATEAG